MAKISYNAIVSGMSGKLGDQLVFRMLRDGRTIVCKKPDFSKRKLSRNQKQHHARFKAAAAYAREASRSEPIYAQLAKGTMKNAYNVALGEWFTPPEIHRVGRYGTAIRIWATDDVQVAGVQVLVLDEEGNVREKGDAAQGRGDWWEYVPAAAGKVVVEAWDLPGNRVKADL